ncbi:MAG: hypothetical protein GYA02_05745 [Clostridiaceae bacterium]|nr:hypothetical protein [Clostridiaceae bacterium]
MISKVINFFLGLVFVSTSVWANNVQITGASRTGTSRNDIQFQLSWENSWNSTDVPGNHDAVWVFIKYRECGLGGDWHHALLSTTMTDHSFGPNLTPVFRTFLQHPRKSLIINNICIVFSFFGCCKKNIYVY